MTTTHDQVTPPTQSTEPAALLTAARRLAIRLTEHGAGSMSDMACGAIAGWIAGRMQHLTTQEVAHELQVPAFAEGLAAAASLLLTLRGTGPVDGNLDALHVAGRHADHHDLAEAERWSAAVERAENAEKRAWLAEQLAEAKAEILALTRQQRDDAQARAKSYLALVEDLREQRDEAREWEGVAQDACREIERHELEVKRLTELARDLSDTSRVQLASIESTSAQLKASRAEVERLLALVEILRRDLGSAQVRSREHEIEVERLTKLHYDPQAVRTTLLSKPAVDALNTEPDEEPTRG